MIASIIDRIMQGTFNVNVRKEIAILLETTNPNSCTFLPDVVHSGKIHI